MSREIPWRGTPDRLLSSPDQHVAEFPSGEEFLAALAAMGHPVSILDGDPANCRPAFR
jgi:hypothetical protein